MLPATGGALAGGRIRTSDGVWRDLLRPTRPTAMGEAEKCSSFPMVPWSNRIRDGVLPFRGRTWQLQRNGADGTAIHGAAAALRLDGHGADRDPRRPRARHHGARRRELPVAVPLADRLCAQRQQAHGRHVGAQRRPRTVPRRLRAPPVPAAHAVAARHVRPADPRPARARGPRAEGLRAGQRPPVGPGRRGPAARRLPRGASARPRPSSTTCSPRGSPAHRCGSATRTSA